MLDRSRVDASALIGHFHSVRAHSVALAAPLSDEDCAAQSMPDASPTKWHLAHTTWFFETFILERFEPGFKPFQEAFRVLFNSYYNGVGEKHPRPQRGLLTRPARAEVAAYRRNVDERTCALLREAVPPEVEKLVELGLQHEQQHQELILTDVLHLLSCNPLFPAYAAAAPAPASSGTPEWLAFDGGIAEIGATPEKFRFDNECPRHRQFLEPFEIASRLTTNAQYLAFVEDGGYQNPSLWLSEGWEFVRAHASAHPLNWHKVGGAWRQFGLRGLEPLKPSSPVLHLSYYEATAFAQWSNARLPTEAEWEHAAPSLPDAFGAAWQWTSSAYTPYPGFKAEAGAIGEYNGKFMVNQYVLRGSSLATPEGHARPTYRNFFPASARWQFTGLRLAK